LDYLFAAWSVASQEAYEWSSDIRDNGHDVSRLLTIDGMAVRAAVLTQDGELRWKPSSE
jgi:hypothetical protein